MDITARVTGHSRDFYTVLSEKGEFKAKLSGFLRYNSVFKSELPVVGDMVEISLRGDKAYIKAVLKRKSHFSRKTAGNIVDEQVLAANIDVLFIVMSLDGNYNLKRLQRYVSAAKSGNIKPVVLLSKSDLCEETASLTEKAKKAFKGVNIFSVSSKNTDTLKVFTKFLKPGVTAAFAGSSGVGKSTLINLILGKEKLKTADISKSTKKGRHTTSSRDMVFLDNGAIVIDTPGIRELGMWDVEGSIGFEKIEELAKSCRFSDCSHLTEPDCAVKQGVEEGEIMQETLDAWRIQIDEKKELEKKKEALEKIIERKKLKQKLDK
ncbi:MAG: ribosome small subunit-dependent GTPase A [bacterium]